MKFYALAMLAFLTSSLAFISCTQSSTPGSSAPGGSGPNIVQNYDWIPAGTKSVLWVGAHPDDEVYVAPILAELCKNRKMDCNLLVLTDGGKGHCNLAGGCSPTVAAVRDIEMRNSAIYFGAQLEKPNFEDSPAGSPDGVFSAWNDSLGGGSKLLDSISSYITRINPDLVFTFDPRHGSSCHLDHRAVGRLVMAALLKVRGKLDSLYFPQAVWATGTVSSTQAWAGNEVVIANDKNVFSVDSTLTWQSLIDVLNIHSSQFLKVKNDYLDAFQFAPPSYRISPVLRALDAKMEDPMYQNLCPYNDARWPGR